MYTLTTYKCHHWDPILAALSVLYTYVIHDDQLCLNGLDTYVFCTVHEQDSVVAKHKRMIVTVFAFAACHSGNGEDDGS